MEQKFREHPNFNTNNFINMGIQYLFIFENGYGANVVCHSSSYGGHEGLYELAVLFDDYLCYDTEITDDVLGWLTVEDVLKTLERIKELNKPNPTAIGKGTISNKNTCTE
ncbi:hypothetical protein P3U10_04360 [Mammaliicoccus sciuri]|uniref:hypothetical protein n=1 Tax=Mammaliicoccus sciuri TaxID=1296 RepID=UPI002B25BED0|nr:hypothetical protein [Mammaliicoccus sciuri]WQK61416.1 hypothetical protein P3U10_04360 [Mammaliicoccus sciuri]